MVHGKNRIPYRIDRRLNGLADLTMMLPSRLGCPLSRKTPNMGNTGEDSLYGKSRLKQLARRALTSAVRGTE